MNLAQLGGCVRKEFLLLSRDLHGLLLLFVMPAAFVLVMSLAMQDDFAARGGKKLVVAVIDQDQSQASFDLLKRVRNTDAFEVRDTAAKDSMFTLTIGHGYGEQLVQANNSTRPPVILHVAADAPKQTQVIVAAALREALGRQGVDELLKLFRSMRSAPATVDTDDNADAAMINRLFAVEYAYKAEQIAKAPTAVQQNVPAWLVFGVFYIVIPVSNTLIRERQFGTLRRLQSTRIDRWTQLLGKLVPYFVINQVQVAFMLAIGVFLVPLLGGDALAMNGSPLALATIAAAVSLGALGYALLIATLAKTTEQATIIGGAGNIVLAALGGIMVPKFVMPETMQKLANISPMSWGLDGFLDVLLRDGGMRDVLPEAAGLALFGLVSLALAAHWYSRSTE